MKLDYGDGEKEVIASVQTLMIYEQEFDADLIQDLFGRVVIRKEDDSDDVVMALDYRDANWTALIRVLWAMLKTADDSIPPFDEWEKSLGDIDLYSIVGAIVPEVRRRFFRTGEGDSE